MQNQTETLFYSLFFCLPIYSLKMSCTVFCAMFLCSGYEEEEKDKKIQMTAQVIRVKEEQLEEMKKPVVSSQAQSKDGDTATLENQQDKDSLNLFLQKPGSFSKFSKLLEITKMAQDSDVNSQNSHSAPTTTTSYYPSHPTSHTATTQQGLKDKTDTSVPFLLKSTPWMIGSPQSILHDDQLSKMLTEKSNQWFSLLPRSPCDESSVTSDSSPPASSSPPQTICTKSPSSLSPNLLSTASSSTPAEINNMQLSVLQVGR